MNKDEIIKDTIKKIDNITNLCPQISNNKLNYYIVGSSAMLLHACADSYKSIKNYQFNSIIKDNNVVEFNYSIEVK